MFARHQVFTRHGPDIAGGPGGGPRVLSDGHSQEKITHTLSHTNQPIHRLVVARERGFARVGLGPCEPCVPLCPLSCQMPICCQSALLHASVVNFCTSGGSILCERVPHLLLCLSRASLAGFRGEGTVSQEATNANPKMYKSRATQALHAHNEDEWKAACAALVLRK